MNTRKKTDSLVGWLTCLSTGQAWHVSGAMIAHVSTKGSPDRYVAFDRDRMILTSGNPRGVQRLRIFKTPQGARKAAIKGNHPDTVRIFWDGRGKKSK